MAPIQVLIGRFLALVALDRAARVGFRVLDGLVLEQHGSPLAGPGDRRAETAPGAIRDQLLHGPVHHFVDDPLRIVRRPAFYSPSPSEIPAAGLRLAESSTKRT